MAIPDYVKNRRFSFEVSYQTEARWLIHGIFDDEETAQADAHQLLRRDDVDEVKIVRQRARKGGAEVQSVVFHEKNAHEKKPVTLSAELTTAPACDSLGAFCALPARRIMGRLLRQYFVERAILPTELLYSWSHFGKFANTGALMGAAVHAVARAQARTSGRPAKEHIALLEGLAQQALQQMRDMASEARRLPAFDAADPGGLSDRIMTAHGRGHHDAIFLFLLSTRYLFALRSLPARLSAMLDLAEKTPPGQRVTGLVDGVIADCLGFAEVIEYLFGEQRTLGGFLMRLADVISGVVPDEMQTEDDLARLTRLLSGGDYEQSRQILAARLASELASDRPLDKRDSKADEALFATLRKHLDRDGDILGGEAVRQALKIRKRRLRRASLLAMGMPDAADAVEIPLFEPQ
jgi:hypothetical protein